MTWTLARRAERLNPSVIREILKLTERPGIVSLAGGLPSPDGFPVEALRAATERVVTTHPREALQYAASEGYAPLREWVAAQLPWAVDPAQVIITTGSQQGLDLVGKVLIDAGSRVLVETPTYLGALQAFAPMEPEPVGVARYLRIDPAVGSIEVGHINYSPALQRTPAATEAMYLMMRRVFAELGYRRYEWKCDALNAPSRGAAERLGFRFEGIFRQATIYKGRNRDTAWYSILDTEWPAVEHEFARWLDPGNFHGDGTQRSVLSMPR